MAMPTSTIEPRTISTIVKVLMSLGGTVGTGVVGLPEGEEVTVAVVSSVGIVSPER